MRISCCVAVLVSAACGGADGPKLTSGAYELVDGLWSIVETNRIWRPTGERAALVITCGYSSSGPDPRQRFALDSVMLLQVTRDEVPSALIRCVLDGKRYVPDLAQLPTIPGWTASLSYTYHFTYSSANYEWQLVLSSGSMQGATRYDIPPGPRVTWPRGASYVTTSAGGCTFVLGEPPSGVTHVGCEPQ